MKGMVLVAICCLWTSGKVLGDELHKAINTAEHAANSKVTIDAPVFSTDAAANICVQYGYVRVLVDSTNSHLRKNAKTMNMVLQNLTNGQSYEIARDSAFHMEVNVPFYPWNDVERDNAFFDDWLITCTFYSSSGRLLRLSAASDASFVAMGSPFKLPRCAFADTPAQSHH